MIDTLLSSIGRMLLLLYKVVISHCKIHGLYSQDRITRNLGS